MCCDDRFSRFSNKTSQSHVLYSKKDKAFSTQNFVNRKMNNLTDFILVNINRLENNTNQLNFGRNISTFNLLFCKKHKTDRPICIDMIIFKRITYL